MTASSFSLAFRKSVQTYHPQLEKHTKNMKKITGIETWKVEIELESFFSKIPADAKWCKRDESPKVLYDKFLGNICERLLCSMFQIIDKFSLQALCNDSIYKESLRSHINGMKLIPMEPPHTDYIFVSVQDRMFIIEIPTSGDDDFSCSDGKTFTEETFRVPLSNLETVSLEWQNSIKQNVCQVYIEL